MNVFIDVYMLYRVFLTFAINARTHKQTASGHSTAETPVGYNGAPSEETVLKSG